MNMTRAILTRKIDRRIVGKARVPNRPQGIAQGSNVVGSGVDENRRLREAGGEAEHKESILMSPAVVKGQCICQQLVFIASSIHIVPDYRR